MSSLPLPGQPCAAWSGLYLTHTYKHRLSYYVPWWEVCSTQWPSFHNSLQLSPLHKRQLRPVTSSSFNSVPCWFLPSEGNPPEVYRLAWALLTSPLGANWLVPCLKPSAAHCQLEPGQALPSLSFRPTSCFQALECIPLLPYYVLSY